jgi:hypothetical protein
MNVPVIFRSIIALSLVASLSGPLHAQLGALPIDAGGTLGRVGGAVEGIAGSALEPLGGAARDLGTLAQTRIDRLLRFVEDHSDRVDRDERGEPAVRGEVLLLDPDPAALGTAAAAGFALIEDGVIDGLDIRYARLSTPRGLTLGAAIKRLRKALPVARSAPTSSTFPPPPLPRRRRAGWRHVRRRFRAAARSASSTAASQGPAVWCCRRVSQRERRKQAIMPLRSPRC